MYLIRLDLFQYHCFTLILILINILFYIIVTHLGIILKCYTFKNKNLVNYISKLSFFYFPIFQFFSLHKSETKCNNPINVEDSSKVITIY